MRDSWADVLDREGLLLLPSAHDALTARLAELAGFPAIQCGGFSRSAARHGLPDLDLTHFGEASAAVRDILAATALPVLVDGDDGYGDVKNVARTVRGYESLGASALFIEDQVAPKKCGHMAGHQVVPPELMEAKIQAAVAARQSPDFFLLARTDAIEPEGVDSALIRAERYLVAGADGVYLEGPRIVGDLEKIGSAFKGTPLATSIMEGGGKTPWVHPDDLKAMGFTMILYPTTVLFRMTYAIREALGQLRNGGPIGPDAVDLEEFEDLIGLPEWESIEKQFAP
jgi:2-methylisocitrate lyase-like PEP mutase family enzyme